MALTQSQRIGIIEARTLAKANTRAELIDALALCDSPTVEGLSPAELARVPLDHLHAAAFGTLSAMAEELAAIAEDLDGQVTQAAELLAERTPERSADYWAVTIAGLAANARRPRPSAHTHDRCDTCHRDAHYPGSAGNHGHPYKAPASSRQA